MNQRVGGTSIKKRDQETPHSHQFKCSCSVAAVYLIVAILANPTVLFYIRARRDQFREADWLFAAAATSILSELSFTLYSAVTDIFNLLGQVYKIGATLRMKSAPGRGVHVIVEVPRRAA